jgi:Family of unknown function (DUF5338)
MGKSLSERIAARAANNKPPRSAQNRGAFLALRGEVEQALDDGWPIKTIWETLHQEGKVTFSYQSFRGYANRLIPARGQAAQPPGMVDQCKALRPGAGATDKAMEERTSQKAAGIGGFRFEAEPRKEDLL